MAQRFYDTKTAQIRDFVPIIPGEVSVYYCGATVQGMPHVGHVRSAIVFDVLLRWLEFSGLKVTSVRNVTDIDDKILEKSAASFDPDFQPDEHYQPREAWWALAYRFEQEFTAAYDALGVRRPTYEPRATGHITEMIELINRLIDTGHAYPALDDSGDVYFDVRSWPDYGQLTRQSVDDLQDAPDADPRGKRDPRDFALWKGHKAGDPDTASWPSPWGRGRPGWHVECSAMATKYLGSQFDIHGGGLDLRFPHHENELAQSTAAGDGFAQFWLHNGLVAHTGQKMSKSIGNTISPEEMLRMARPKAVRYFLGQAHYRSQLDYQESSLLEAQSAIERIENFQTRAHKLLDPVDNAAAHAEVPVEFRQAMEDDLNVPAALAVLHETVRTGNTVLTTADSVANTPDSPEAVQVREQLSTLLNHVDTMVSVLGLNDVLEPEHSGQGPAHQALEALVSGLIAARAAAREARDWAQADAVRDQLSGAGIQLEDSTSGASWSLTGH